MADTRPTTGLPLPAQLELANMSDGLRRWTRLKLLEESSNASYQDEGVTQLRSAIVSAFPEAQAHAEALAAFYERNAADVNSMIAATAANDGIAEGAHGRARQVLGELGVDPAAALAQHARDFIRLRQDQLCQALLNLMLEAYACCQGGVEASCGTLYGDLYERHCAG